MANFGEKKYEIVEALSVSYDAVEETNRAKGLKGPKKLGEYAIVKLATTLLAQADRKKNGGYYKGGSGKGKMKQCPKCKKWIPAGFKYHKECGHSFNEGGYSQTSGEKSKEVKPENSTKPRTEAQKVKIFKEIGNLKKKGVTEASIKKKYGFQTFKHPDNCTGKDKSKKYLTMGLASKVIGDLLELQQTKK